MAEKSFAALIEDASTRDSFHVEKAVLQFTSDLYGLMKARGLSKADLARVLGTTPAYVTKVFRGDANFTIESMVRLSRAVGGRLSISLKAERGSLGIPDSGGVGRGD